ncbi:response regulator [bacterium]|nr:response regulator [bacterium]
MKKKLLVADDEKNLRLLYQTELEDEGYDVTVAENAQEVLDLLKTKQYDLIILDIQMPGMNGIELMEKILAKDKRQLVILNTAYSVYKDNFMTWSADAYVVKSGDLTELKTRVKELLTSQQAK